MKMGNDDDPLNNGLCCSLMMHHLLQDAQLGNGTQEFLIFSLDTGSPHTAILSSVDVNHTSYGPLITDKAFSEDKDEVSHGNVPLWILPSCALTKEGEVLPRPPGPKHICQVLHLAPLSSAPPVLGGEEAWWYCCWTMQ